LYHSTLGSRVIKQKKKIPRVLRQGLEKRVADAAPDKVVGYIYIFIIYIYIYIYTHTYIYICVKEVRCPARREHLKWF